MLSLYLWCLLLDFPWFLPNRKFDKMEDIVKIGQEAKAVRTRGCNHVAI